MYKYALQLSVTPKESTGYCSFFQDLIIFPSREFTGKKIKIDFNSFQKFPTIHPHIFIDHIDFFAIQIVELIKIYVSMLYNISFIN